MKRENLQNSIMMLMIGGAAGAALTWAGITYGGGGSVSGKHPEFAKLSEGMKILEEEDVPFDEENAISGFFSGGIDQYSGYKSEDDSNFTPAEYVNTSGTALASGFTIDKAESGRILIVTAEEDKAAYRCGLREGDEIVSIDGVDVVSRGFDNIANKLLGKQDTVSELVVLRNGSELNVTFKRDNDPMRFFDWEEKDGIGYIRIEKIDTFTAGYMSQAAKELSGLKGYIIDLRDNSGGPTNVCVDMLKNIAPGEKLVMRSFKGEVTESVADTDPDVISGPVVLLVNRNTASCAEAIVAAVKKFNHEAVVVGEQTYGKGIYQMSATLESGGTLHYTVGDFWIDGADSWNKNGIAPDTVIEMDPALIGTDEDIQLSKAFDLLG